MVSLEQKRWEIANNGKKTPLNGPKILQQHPVYVHAKPADFPFMQTALYANKTKKEKKKGKEITSERMSN